MEPCLLYDCVECNELIESKIYQVFLLDTFQVEGACRIVKTASRDSIEREHGWSDISTLTNISESTREEESTVLRLMSQWRVEFSIQTWNKKERGNIELCEFTGGKVLWFATL